ncbi:MAG TPA: CocE/NonD family hydrolase, partial [Thermodesulfobacteriota bacterium]|nr:CocE/NonD family hydrolase [Thermodesulfobacteriota bacterium]
MNLIATLRIFCPIMAAGLMAATGLFEKEAEAREKVSQLGRYHCYSEAVYDGTVRRSDYLTLSDGTRLAYDLILPAKEGIPAKKPLPVLFKYTPYLRTYRLFEQNGKSPVADLYRWSMEEQNRVQSQARMSQYGLLFDPLLRNRYLINMVKSGYAVVVVERPGTGASFGRSNPSFEAQAKEANEILNWIGSQPWSNGRIGMYGDSWQGQTQLAAASTGNPYLKTIVPVGTWMDNYSSILYPGGIMNKAFIDFFSWTQKILSSEVITPVDSDLDGALLARARQERTQSPGFSFADFVRMFP